MTGQHPCDEGGPCQARPDHSKDVVESLRNSLHALGYASATTRAYLRAVEHFRRQLETEGRDLLTASHEDVKAFLTCHLPVCRCPMPAPKDLHGVRAALRHWLTIANESDGRPTSIGSLPPVAQELRDFRAYLIDICGLSESTCTSRLRYAGEFLGEMFKARRIGLRNLEPHAVMEWVARRSQRCKPGTAGVIASCVSSYLRFCQFRGLIDERLLHAVPAIPRRRLIDVPRYLDDEDLQRFLCCFDTSTPVGCRDHAMALCMVEMGLRAAEVARMRLRDIDWRQSILHIRETKGARERALPLPHRPGRAIARYVRQGRPRTTGKSLFVRHSVPLGTPLTPELVRGAMRRAYARVGLPPQWCGTHLLRHTAATRMHQRGASLKEVADVLGHRSIDTSVIYTKVNLPALKTVALPWPGVKS